MFANKQEAQKARMAFLRLARVYMPTTLSQREGGEDASDYWQIKNFFDVAEAALPVASKTEGNKLSGLARRINQKKAAGK